MAKFTPGPLAGAISGSIGGATFSHNRFGPYIRRRAIPVTSTTPYALDAKANFAAASTAWQLLAAADKLTWNTWALSNPITNSLGQTQQLTGHQCYTGLHARALACGKTPLTAPSVLPAPAPLTSLIQTCDIGAGTFDLQFLATPLGGADYLYIQAALTDSAGIHFVKNLLRFIGITAAAQASPFDHQAQVTARFGTLPPGNYVHAVVSVFSSISMLLSPPLKVRTIVSES